MTPDHPLHDLLHDWSNREPDRVVLTIGSTIAVRVQGIAFGVSMPGVVLAAVIEAVESKGWTWSLGGSGGEYIAFVYWSPDEVPGRGRLATAPASMLAAYLAALEAEAGQ